MTDTPTIKQNAIGIWMLEGEQLWDSDILPVCLEHIKEGDTVIDAGAWIGGHTMAYAKKVGVNGKVIAFEPNPAAYNCLVLNTGQFGNVDCFGMALGDERKIVSLNSKRGWFDSSHICLDGMLIQVPMETLDIANVAPNFIKIDVEGCELKVLKGAEKTIEKYRPIIVIEINQPALERQGSTPQEVVLWLGRHNYGMNMIEECTGQNIYNILCIPR